VTLFVISDTHFGHYNMVHTFKREDGSPARDFASVQEHDERMIANWNAVVMPQDHVYHLGDVTMNPSRNLHLIKRLNGHKRLVLGNHDSGKAQEYLAAGFQKLFASRVLDGWMLTHIPIHPESLSQRWKGNVHGHTHHQCYGAPYINVCVEQTGYRPVALEELRLP
jgi:calcineurin-like phosphoesterase family protein